MKYFLSLLFFVFVGCAYDLPLVFEPVASPDASIIYTNGVPMAGTSIDSLSLFLSMDRKGIIGSYNYRLWVICENISELSVLVDPVKMFSLIAVPKSTSNIKQEFRMEPQSPEILVKLEDSGVDPEILRKNTLFKNQSVSGYVYFRQDLRVYSKSGYYVYNGAAWKFDYRVIVHSPGDSRTIGFKITQGAQ